MNVDVSDLVVNGHSILKIIEAARNADPITENGITASANAAEAGLEVLKAIEEKLLIAQDLAEMTEIVTANAENDSVVVAVASAIRFSRPKAEAALTRMKGLQRGMTRAVNVLHRAAIADVKRQTEEQRDATRLKRRQTGLKGVFPNSPIPAGIVIPAGFIVNKNGVFAIREKKNEDEEEQIAANPLLIVGRKVDLNGDEEILSLSWFRGSRWKTRDFERASVFQARELASNVSSAGGPVASDNAAACVRFLRLFEARNYEALPESKVSRRIGWIGDPGEAGFLFGEEHVGGVEPVELLAVEGYKRTATGYRTKGTFEDWIKAIEPAIERPVAMSAIYASVASLLVDIIGVDNFIVDYAGMSGGGKTTAAMLAASVHGNPNKFGGGAIHGWDSNPAFIDRLCDFIGGGFPFILDESQKAPFDGRVKAVVYIFANGHSKGRGSVKAVRESGQWRNVMISTGEQPLTSFIGGGRAEGVGARILHFSASPFGERTDANRKKVDALTKGILTSYGHLGRRAAGWLTDNRASWPDLIKRYEALVDEYSSKPEIEGSGYRIAKYVAALHVAAELSHNHLGLPRPFGSDPIAAVWKAAARSVAATDNASDALEALHAFAVANQTSFDGRHETRSPPREWFGAWKSERSGSATWDQIAIIKTKAIEVLKSHGFNGERELQEMNRRGWLSATKSRARKGSFAKSVRVSGSPVPCVCIRREALRSIMDEDAPAIQVTIPTTTTTKDPPF